MTPGYDPSQTVAVFGVGALLLLLIGLYCLIATRHLIRTLIGLVLLTKAATLLLVLAGTLVRQTALAQALIITVIIVEVALVVVGIGIILRIYEHRQTLDVASPAANCNEEARR
jgi:multisubunit Na+/H+ antiporter MnhC subunit